jgi:FkbM family methyltransferase
MKKIKIIIYSLLDRLIFTKGVKRTINGFDIYFPSRWSRYFEGDYEQENVLFLKKAIKPGSVVLDIGAHLGLISIISSTLAGNTGKVFAFEPTPDTFRFLKKNLSLNHATNVEPINKAIAKSKGHVDFFITPDEGSNANSLVSIGSRQRKPIKIETISVDDFAESIPLQKIDLIKIDAEGTEYDVLLGAKNSIGRFRPSIILAIHPSLIRNNNQDTGDIYDLIKTFGYSVMYKEKNLDKNSFCKINDFFDVHLIPQK